MNENVYVYVCVHESASCLTSPIMVMIIAQLLCRPPYNFKYCYHSNIDDDDDVDDGVWSFH